MNKVHFSSVDQTFATPKILFSQLDAEFHFTIDACATKATAKTKRFYSIEDDGLSHSWQGERVFMNPPYGDAMGVWMEKAYTEAGKNCLVVCLIAARTDTQWWHDYVMRASQIRFIKGRVPFKRDESGAHADKPKSIPPFPSCVVVFPGNCRAPKISTLKQWIDVF